jgi:glutamate carboxypeptidase
MARADRRRFSALPGEIGLEKPAPVEAVDPRADGQSSTAASALDGAPDAPVQLLFTGHMDTVFGAITRSSRRAGSRMACSTARRRRHEGRHRGDARGLKAVEQTARDRIGYEVVINSDEEVGSPARRRCSRGGSRESARLDL